MNRDVLVQYLDNSGKIPDDEPILRFENVGVKYGEMPVLTDFTAEIREGEFVSLIGPNGSGKTTIINAVLQLIPLANGKIYLAGRDNESYTAKERSRFAAVVPQTFSTSFAFTVRDIVRMGRNPYLKRFQSESEEDLRIVDEALKYTDTYRLKERRITELSGGERQRVVISGALAQTPRLLILDEPTNHLDLNHTLEIMQLLSELNKTKGMTVFAVLHDINMASRYSNRLILMDSGKIIKDGPASEVIKEEVLGPVYGIDLVSRKNRLTDSIEIVPIRKRTVVKTIPEESVHVVCGGGSGEALLEELRNKGYPLSCGVINVSDSDAEACKNLSIPYIEEAPYSPVSDEKHIENLKAMNASDIIILTAVPIGSGNLKNMEAVSSCAESGTKRVYIINSSNRDFTGGAADRIVSSLIDSGANEIDLEDLLDRIQQGQL